MSVCSLTLPFQKGMTVMTPGIPGILRFLYLIYPYPPRVPMERTLTSPNLIFF